MLLHNPALHAIYLLCNLSRQPSGQVVSAARVAEAMEVPSEQAAKLLQTLQGVGIVEAVRGRSGGYRLARALTHVTVLEVLDAVAARDESDQLKARACPESPPDMCTAHAGLRELNERVRRLLGGTTLADVLGEPCGTESPETAESRPA